MGVFSLFVGSWATAPLEGVVAFLLVGGPLSLVFSIVFMELFRGLIRAGALRIRLLANLWWGPGCFL